jgi:hypothetical protein
MIRDMHIIGIYFSTVQFMSRSRRRVPRTSPPPAVRNEVEVEVVDESLALHLLHDDLLPPLIITITILFLVAAIMDLGKRVAG